MTKGWISLHRKILDNPMLRRNKQYSNFEAFIWILLHCNFEDKKVLIGNKLYLCKRGSFITSQKKLMLTFNWSVSRLRAYLKLMESDGTLVVESFSTHTYLTISNYDTYQNPELQKNQKKIANRLQKETTNNTNNINKDNKKERVQKFFKKVEDIFDEKFSKYPKSVLAEFCEYWTESNPNGKQLRYEKQNVFDINRRLKTWIKRSNYDNSDDELLKKKEEIVEQRYLEQQEKFKKADEDVASDDERKKALGLK